MVVGWLVGLGIGIAEGDQDSVGERVGVTHCFGSGNTTSPRTRSFDPLEMTSRIRADSEARTMIFDAAALATSTVMQEDDLSSGGHASTSEPSIGTSLLIHELAADHIAPHVRSLSVTLTLSAPQVWV